MPIEQPNNAPNTDRDLGGSTPKDGDSVASVLSDSGADDTPGGGGLMGADAGGPDAGTAAGQAGAATPNSPIDAELPLVGGSDDHDRPAEREAQTLALGEDRADE